MREEKADEEYLRIPLPKREEGEMFAIADQLMGGSRVKVICEDGKARIARIPGRVKRKQRIRAGDLVIVKPWSVQDEKADIIFRYTHIEAVNLSRRGLLPKELDVF
ncbi:MAG: translation initiation factor eIF-1A [Thermoplasmata archaeon]|nr:MAG: translation initiation factor eIF-1A [Thermoplasmata archaeon]RLF39345.1 MAG: translation initiation factor eIF-1A [Thermoplasmata archaeon]